MTPSKALKPLRKLAVCVPDAEGMAELRYRGFVEEMAALYGANATAAQIRRCSTLIELARAALQDGFDAIVKMDVRHDSLGRRAVVQHGARHQRGRIVRCGRVQRR